MRNEFNLGDLKMNELQLQFKALRQECVKVMLALDIEVAHEQLDFDLPLYLGDVDKLMSYFEEATEEHRHGFNQMLAFYSPDERTRAVYFRSDLAATMPAEAIRGMLAHELVHSLQGDDRLMTEISTVDAADLLRLDTRMEVEAYTIGAFFERYSTADEIIVQLERRAAKLDMSIKEYVYSQWESIVKPGILSLIA